MWISLDPGIVGTGLALWENSNRLKTTQIITPIPTGAWDEKCYEIAGIVKLIARVNKVEKVYIEFPKVFASIGGLMVAKKGNIGKLTYLCGTIAGCLMGITKVELIDVNAWKGQLPKDVVASRIRRMLPGVQAKSHEWDAIGIGLYVQKRF